MNEKFIGYAITIHVLKDIIRILAVMLGEKVEKSFHMKLFFMQKN